MATLFFMADNHQMICWNAMRVEEPPAAKGVDPFGNPPGVCLFGLGALPGHCTNIAPEKTGKGWSQEETS
ncbi:hypothetical protein [Desulfovibrio sp. TomC]|uniref:hypothetical protein n=1 Tax=Desulfovibrio sp. TomC TaxID=1562888 RepID=UPI0012E281A6|nr:hypothetical protein [Desulfovibrio sp. TomC]